MVNGSRDSPTLDSRSHAWLNLEPLPVLNKLSMRTNMSVNICRTLLMPMVPVVLVDVGVLLADLAKTIQQCMVERAQTDTTPKQAVEWLSR